MRISLLILVGIAVAAAWSVAAQNDASGPAAANGERMVKIVARRFVFNPSDIVLKKGQPVVFELTTLDFGHGFSVPDLDFRADFVPEKTIIVRMTPKKAGKFEFLCDNFCGSGHEEMDGHIIVEE